MDVVYAERVAEYYDHNTAPFLRWGGSGVDVAAIHRALWGPNVVNSAQAFEYANRYVFAQLEGLPAHAGSTRVVDLGCGIGGTCTWLATRAHVHVTGVTLSPVQCRWARERAAQLRLSDRCSFLTADMTETGLNEPFALAYAIESLIHVAEPDAFFREAARLLRPGGKLVLCDDFLAPNPGQSRSKARWLATFERGWHAFGLRTWARTVDVAAAHGFSVSLTEDVSAWQRTVSPWLVRLGDSLLRIPFLRSPYWDSLRGSTALQHCVRQGWVEYRLATFTRAE